MAILNKCIKAWRNFYGRSSAFLKQLIRRQPVRGGLLTMGFHPADLCFEQVNALCQLVLRLGGEVFARQFASSIAFGPGKIINIQSAYSVTSCNIANVIACCQCKVGLVACFRKVRRTAFHR